MWPSGHRHRSRCQVFPAGTASLVIRPDAAIASWAGAGTSCFRSRLGSPHPGVRTGIGA
jgi:hypothetical protein